MILDVMVESENQLFRVMNSFRANSLELAHHGRGVVVSHDVEGTNGDKVTSPQRPLRAFGKMGLGDLFNNCLGHSRDFRQASLARTAGNGCPYVYLISSGPSVGSPN